MPTKGLIAAIRESYPNASCRRYKVHFLRNILSHVPQKEKKTFAAQLKEIWMVPSDELARRRAEQLSEQYGKQFPRAIQLQEAFTDFPWFRDLDDRKISSTNMLERLNKEMHRRISVVGIFPNQNSSLRLATTYLMEYADNWSVSRAGYPSRHFYKMLPDLYFGALKLQTALLTQPSFLPNRAEIRPLCDSLYLLLHSLC